MITALGKRILVQELHVEEKQEGLLILPDRKRQMVAIVIGVGSEVDKNVEPGSFIYMLPETGVEVEIEGDKFLSVMENQVLAVYSGFKSKE